MGVRLATRDARPSQEVTYIPGEKFKQALNFLQLPGLDELERRK
jgi:hypothetical protein